MNNPTIAVKKFNQTREEKNMGLSQSLVCERYYGDRFLVSLRQGGHTKYQKISKTIEGARANWKIALKLV